jgi:hypothetical protein
MSPIQVLVQEEGDEPSETLLTIKDVIMSFVFSRPTQGFCL